MVRDRIQPVRFTVFLDILPPHIKQRPDNPVCAAGHATELLGHVAGLPCVIAAALLPGVRHAGQAVHTGPPEDPEQDRLRLVVGVVRDGDLHTAGRGMTDASRGTAASRRTAALTVAADRGFRFVRHLTEGVVSCLPAGLLAGHPQLFRQRVAVHGEHPCFQPKPAAQVDNICLVRLRGARPELMVHVNRVDRKTQLLPQFEQHMKQADRIGSARKADHDVVSLLD